MRPDLTALTLRKLIVLEGCQFVLYLVMVHLFTLTV
jgi:hypothetical protein